MKVGLEVYISLILLVVVGLLCANFIASDVATMNARDIQAAYVTEIENSDFADSVIHRCEKNAQDRGYKLNVQKVTIGESEMAEVSLTYVYKVPLIGVESEHVITGYAK